MHLIGHGTERRSGERFYTFNVGVSSETSHVSLCSDRQKRDTHNFISRLDHKSRRLFLSLPIDSFSVTSRSQPNALPEPRVLANACFFDDFFLTAATEITLKAEIHRVNKQRNFFSCKALKANLRKKKKVGVWENEKNKKK